MHVNSNLLNKHSFPRRCSLKHSINYTPHNAPGIEKLHLWHVHWEIHIPLGQTLNKHYYL